MNEPILFIGWFDYGMAADKLPVEAQAFLLTVAVKIGLALLDALFSPSFDVSFKITASREEQREGCANSLKRFAKFLTLSKHRGQTAVHSFYQVARIPPSAHSKKEEQMSDTRFSGKGIYKYMSASQAIYDVRGRYIHRANIANQPEYEIRGTYIQKAHSASQPEFEIRGNHIHKAHSASQAIYEIR